MKLDVILFTLLFSIVLLSNVALAQEAKIWTNQTTYVEGDYINVYIQLPDDSFFCEGTYLIDPSGYEFQISGEGECPAGKVKVSEKIGVQEYALVEKYIPSAYFDGFVSTLIENGVEYGRLGDKFGTWTIKATITRNGQPYQTLTTNFEYKYYNAIVGFCRLENVKTKTCTFLDSPFEITRDGGCGPNPVDITVSYYGGTYTLSIKQAEKAELSIGLITVRNMGSPCAVDVLNLRFDKAIPPEETSLKASIETKKIEAKLEGETKVFSLPTEEKTQIIEARVNEENKLKKIAVEVDNAKDALVVESNNIEAETKLPVGIESSKLYVESEGEKFEVNILPDSASEKAKTELESIENIEIVGGSAIYLIKGFKNGKYAEVKLDATTGQLIKEVEVSDRNFIIYIVGGLVVLFLIGVIFIMTRRKKVST